MAGHKYVARVPDTSGKSKWRYFYTTEEYQAFLKGGQKAVKNVVNQNQKMATQQAQLQNQMRIANRGVNAKVKSAAKKAGNAVKNALDQNQKMATQQAQLQNQMRQYNPGTQMYKTNKQIAKQKELDQRERNISNRASVNAGVDRMRQRQKEAQQDPAYQERLRQQNSKNSINKQYAEMQKQKEKQAYERSPQYAQNKQNAHKQGVELKNRTIGKGQYAQSHQDAHNKAVAARKANEAETARRKAEKEYERSSEYQDLRRKKAELEGRTGVNGSKQSSSKTTSKKTFTNTGSAKKLTKLTKSQIDKVKKNVSTEDKIERGKKAVSDFLNKAKSNAKKTGDAVKKKASEVAVDVRDTTKNAVNNTKNAIDKAKKKKKKK